MKTETGQLEAGPILKLAAASEPRSSDSKWSVTPVPRDGKVDWNSAASELPFWLKILAHSNRHFFVTQWRGQTQMLQYVRVLLEKRQSQSHLQANPDLVHKVEAGLESGPRVLCGHSRGQVWDPFWWNVISLRSEQYGAVSWSDVLYCLSKVSTIVLPSFEFKTAFQALPGGAFVFMPVLCFTCSLCVLLGKCDGERHLQAKRRTACCVLGMMGSFSLAHRQVGARRKWLYTVYSIYYIHVYDRQHIQQDA